MVMKSRLDILKRELREGFKKMSNFGFWLSLMAPSTPNLGPVKMLIF